MKPNHTHLQASRVSGVQLYQMPSIADDLRGLLTVAEAPGTLPFSPKRCFMIHGIPPGQTRGNHAHKSCSQLLICPHGECRVHLSDGIHQDEISLTSPDIGVLVPPMVWASEHYPKANSILLVLASHTYEKEDYIHDYAEFLALRKMNSHLHL